ncbi:unnamed protein product [Diamesa serratosioi]
MSLNDCFDLARKEIREDDTRKAQALIQFREWISKHPAFKNYRIDDSFFLQFLRARKYNNSQAYELYENYFVSLKTNPLWYFDDEKSVDKMMKTIDRGVNYPLLKRDADGRKIVIFRFGKLDTTIDTPESLLSLNIELITQLIEDEDTQIAGIILIFDFTGFAIKLMSTFALADIPAIANLTVKSITGRIKCIHVMNLPPYARIIFDIFKMTLSDKLKKRMVLSKDLEDLKTKIDEKLLPKELGGIIPEAVMIKEFKETIKQNQKKRQEIYDTKVDLNMIMRKKKEESGTGSFRKLEVD